MGLYLLFVDNDPKFISSFKRLKHTFPIETDESTDMQHPPVPIQPSDSPNRFTLYHTETDVTIEISTTLDPSNVYMSKYIGPKYCMVSD